MTLRELVGNGAADVEVSSLAYASEQVAPGALFFCVPGLRTDGHQFAREAVARGAVALVCERPLGTGVPEVVVPDARAAMGPIAARFHGDPSAELSIAGITGTNGKTTTAFLVRHLLEAAGMPAGLLGTVKSVIGGSEQPVERTTPEAIDLHAAFRRMLEQGDRACVMEVSSHALQLRRADGIHFACKAFTNLTPEHLDFHPTMEDYFLAKRRLFQEPGPAVVNLDDPYGRRLAGELGDVTTFAVQEDADFRARGVRFDWSGSRFTCGMPDGEVEVAIALPGPFNVSNALAAIAVARIMGVPAGAIAPALARAGRVPGRFEPVDRGQDFAVVVDYAHSPDSLAHVLRAARELTEGRLHVVFGAGGDRDRAKRPSMGRVASELADRVIVTSDNPRSEDPQAIIAEVMEGVVGAVEREPDRRAAIELGIRTAASGDAVVIAGKGHEQGQEAGGRTRPFDDRAVAAEALQGRQASVRERGGAAR